MSIVDLADLIVMAKSPEFSAACVPALLECATKHLDRPVGQGAVYLLGKLGPVAAAAVPSLCEMLVAHRHRLRARCVAQALGKIGSPEALPALQAARRSKTKFVRKAARAAIAEILGQAD